MEGKKKKLFKKHGKEILINSVVGALTGTIIIYVIIGPYNDEFVKLLQAISSDGSALEICLMIFPMILIFYLALDIGKIIAKEK